MLLKNFGLASTIEGYSITYAHAIRMFVSGEQINTLRRQLIALDHLEQYGVNKLTPHQRKLLDLKPEMLLQVTTEAPDPTKKAKKSESDIFGAFSDTKLAEATKSPKAKKSESIDGQETAIRERPKAKAEKPVKDDRVPVPTKYDLVENGDLLAIIISGLKTKCSLSTEPHVKARVIGYLATAPLYDDNREVIRNIADIYAKNRALW